MGGDGNLGICDVGERSVRIDEDFYSWLLDQAGALRDKRVLSLDWDHLAEELEAMAAVERRELLSRLTTLYEHMLKWQYEPQELQRRSRGWRLTITRSRTEIRRLLDYSPGLKSRLEEFAAAAYTDARRQAGEAMGLERSRWDRLLPQKSP